MTCGRGVKHHVVIFRQQVVICQQGGELVKGGNFDGAGAGKLLLNTPERIFGQQVAHRANNALAVGRRAFLGVNLDGREVFHVVDRGDFAANIRGKHLPDIGGGVGADQQHLFAVHGEAKRGGASQRGFAHAAFASEKREFREGVKHGDYPEKEELAAAGRGFGFGTATAAGVGFGFIAPATAA